MLKNFCSIGIGIIEEKLVVAADLEVLK